MAEGNGNTKQFVGKVSGWDSIRGFGFIRLQDGSEFFVHHTGIAFDPTNPQARRNLVPYTLVAFELAPSKKYRDKQEAVNVRAAE